MSEFIDETSFIAVGLRIFINANQSILEIFFVFLYNIH
jgi:hypothetical protein